MSTRFYPRFVKGNPQLRVFLPDWKMVMIRPPEPMPSNVVSFRVDPRMTDWDIKNYLEKIYNVPVAAIKSRIMTGKIERIQPIVRVFDDEVEKLKITKKDQDFKIAHVTLYPGQKFEWPDLFPAEKKEEDKKEIEMVKKSILSEDKELKNPKVPEWFL